MQEVINHVREDLERLGIEALEIWIQGNVYVAVLLRGINSGSWDYELTSYSTALQLWSPCDEFIMIKGVRMVTYKDWRVSALHRLREDPPPRINVLRLAALKVKLQEDIERFPK